MDGREIFNKDSVSGRANCAPPGDRTWTHRNCQTASFQQRRRQRWNHGEIWTSWGRLHPVFSLLHTARHVSTSDGPIKIYRAYRNDAQSILSVVSTKMSTRISVLRWLNANPIFLRTQLSEPLAKVFRVDVTKSNVVTYFKFDILLRCG